MHRYHKLGKVAKKRHTVFRDDNGNIYHEELKGNKGFVGPSSLLTIFIHLLKSYQQKK